MKSKPWGLALILAGLLAGAALLPLTATAQDENQTTSDDGDAAQQDPVVAIVNGEEIFRSEVMASAAQLPPQYQAQLELIFPALVERLVDFKLLDKAAVDEGLADDDEVQARLEELKADIMREVLLANLIEDGVSDDKVQEAYATYLENNPPQAEIRARHILFEGEDKAGAEAAIAQLDEGADFAELAKEFSIGPTGESGGDLGYFTAGQMVPPFSEAAFALEVGDYTKEPVETQFGWHVIKVEDRREQSPPAFEEMEEQLVDQLSRQVVEDYLAGLRENNEVEILLPKAEEEGATTEDGAAQ